MDSWEGGPGIDDQLNYLKQLIIIVKGEITDIDKELLEIIRDVTSVLTEVEQDDYGFVKEFSFTKYYPELNEIDIDKLYNKMYLNIIIDPSLGLYSNYEYVVYSYEDRDDEPKIIIHDDVINYTSFIMKQFFLYHWDKLDTGKIFCNSFTNILYGFQEEEYQFLVGKLVLTNKQNEKMEFNCVIGEYFQHIILLDGNRIYYMNKLFHDIYLFLDGDYYRNIKSVRK